MIRKRKIKGITYIIERTTDKNGKRHETVIGKVDENGNEIYYADSRDNHASGGKERGHDVDTLTHKYCISQLQDSESDEVSLTPDEAPKEIVSDKTTSLKSILIDLNKISQKAFSSDVNITLYRDEPIKIAMERKGTSKEINTFVFMNFDFGKVTEEGLRIIGTEKLTPFDKIILDAINSLYIEGHNQYITTQMIFHVITGDPDRRITPNYAQEINNSITKLLFTRIIIKAHEEAIMYPELKDFEYHDTIVPGKIVKAILNGTEVACVKIRDIPPLYLYASKKKQISKVDIDLIRLPFAKGTKESKEDVSLLHYLLRRIIALKSISNYIKYDTLYDELGYSNATVKKKFSIRKKVREILDTWKGSVFGDIEIIDYQEVKDGLVPREIVIKFKIRKESEKKNNL